MVRSPSLDAEDQLVKLGAHVSALKNPRKAPYKEAMEAAGRLGFEGVELIAMDVDELYNYYTDQIVGELVSIAREQHLTISQFAIYSPACEGLASLDPHEKERGIETFQRGIQVCRDLGCDIINLVSHWPIGLSAPIDYPPTYIYPIVRGVSSIASPKLEMELPEPFDFAAIWDNYIDSLRIVAALAADSGIRLAIEGHTHVIVSGTDAMLRLFDHIENESLVVNLDTSWHFIQREYLPMSIHKLNRKVAHVHVRDADGLLFYGVPPGQGIIDWHGVVRALADVGYDGFLSLELHGYADHLRIAGESRDYLERVIAETLG